MLEEVATEGASIPIVVIDGLVQIRDSSEPVPMVCTPSSRPESRRSCSSVKSRSEASPAFRPATATSPSSSCSEAMVRTSAVIASGTAPPNMPLWMPWSRARTVSTTRIIPRRVVVRAGSPTAQLVESASTMASARSFSPCRSRIVARLSEPISSSPSTKTVTPTGSSPPWARRAATWAITPALSSAMPRA